MTSTNAQNKAVTIDELPGVMRSIHPEQPSPVVFDSPHSGRDYPAKAKFNHACTREHARFVEDSLVDELIADCTKSGVTLLNALIPRSYVDFNRPRDCLYLPDIRGDWNKVEYDPHTSRFALRGAGVVPVKTGQGLSAFLYHNENKPDADDINARLRKYWDPYHNKLESIVKNLHQEFGVSYHINCHSMPRTCAIEDIVLGDRFGECASPDFTEFVKDTLEQHPAVKRNKWSVGINTGLATPLSGEEIVRKHGNPARNIHSLQLEIKRMHYIDEQTRRPNAGYLDVKMIFEDLAQALADYALKNAPAPNLSERSHQNAPEEPYPAP